MYGCCWIFLYMFDITKHMMKMMHLNDVKSISSFKLNRHCFVIRVTFAQSQMNNVVCRDYTLFWNQSSTRRLKFFWENASFALNYHQKGNGFALCPSRRHRKPFIIENWFSFSNFFPTHCVRSGYNDILHCKCITKRRSTTPALGTQISEPCQYVLYILLECSTMYNMWILCILCHGQK